MDFDPAEFDQFKAGKAATPEFDAGEFASFKKGPEKKKFGLGDTWPARIAKAIYGGVTLPGDVVQGKVSMTDEDGNTNPEVIGRAAELASVASPLSPAARVGVGWAGVPKTKSEAIPPPVPQPAPTNEIAAASARLAETGNPVEVPRAIASDSMVAQRSGQAIRNIPIVGDAIPKATARLGEQLEGAATGVASEFGGGSGQNVAHSIGQTIGSAAEREALTAKSAAAQSDQAILGDWERSIAGANEAIAVAEAGALTRARQSIGNMSPQDMGETLTARLRQGEREAHATKERLYGIASKSDGAIDANAVRSLRADVGRALDEGGAVVDPVLTPAAARMMAELDNAPLRASGDMARRQPVAAPARPIQTTQASAPIVQEQSLLEFLALKGGLGPDQELGAIGAHGHTVAVEGVGRRKLVRDGGLRLDSAREAAEEAGYLRGEANKTSTTREFLDLIDAELRGQKRYREGAESYTSKRENVARSEREQHEYSVFNQRIEEDLAAAGHGQLGAEVKQRTVQLMKNERLDADTAVEKAFRQLEQEDKAIGGGFPGNRGPADRGPAMVSMQSLEQTRKRLNAMSGAATNDADRRAARLVINEFDKRLGDAFDNALFSGSDDALQAYRAARAANTEWRQRFGFNARDDADRVINRIVTGEVTPQEVSNYIIGASKVGSKGVSSRLLTRIQEATAGDPEAMAAIRGGVWNRLTDSTEGTAPKAGIKVADDIGEFLNGSGRDVANRLFTEQQRAIMRTYAGALRQGAEARGVVADIAANTRPSAMEVGIGPLQRLANDVLGKGGGRSDEALYSAINAYAKSGARGDISLLSKVLQVIPEKDRGNLASAMIRDMGVSPRTGQFSPDVFVSSWGSYKPEAKALLFGMSGPQRVALDDIAKISLRMKEVGSKFGNPSGTAQNVNLLALAGGFMAAPLTTLAAGIGGAVTAKVLSSPVGASSVSKWSRAYERAAMLPSPSNTAALQRATNLLAINVSRETGAPIKDLARQLQGPVPVSAENEKR